MGVSLCKLNVIFTICICLSLPSILAKPIKYCDKKAKYAVKVHGVDISPDPVKVGRPAVFSISASAGEDLSGGDVVIDVSYFGLHVYSETVDLCKESSCPIAAGDFVLSHKQTLPIFTPPGSYTLKMRMQDSNKHVLTCFTFTFSIGYGSSVSDI